MCLNLLQHALYFLWMDFHPCIHIYIYTRFSLFFHCLLVMNWFCNFYFFSPSLGVVFFFCIISELNFSKNWFLSFFSVLIESLTFFLWQICTCWTLLLLTKSWYEKIIGRWIRELAWLLSKHKANSNGSFSQHW